MTKIAYGSLLLTVTGWPVGASEPRSSPIVSPFELKTVTSSLGLGEGLISGSFRAYCTTLTIAHPVLPAGKTNDGSGFWRKTSGFSSGLDEHDVDVPRRRLCRTSRFRWEVVQVPASSTWKAVQSPSAASPTFRGRTSVLTPLSDSLPPSVFWGFIGGIPRIGPKMGARMAGRIGGIAFIASPSPVPNPVSPPAIGPVSSARISTTGLMYLAEDCFENRDRHCLLAPPYLLETSRLFRYRN